MVGRPERELREDGTPLTALAIALRELRRSAGSPSYREMGQRVHRSPTTLSEAAGGERHPTWDTLHAYVTACGGDPSPWRDRWEAAARRESPKPVPPAVAGPEPAHVPAPEIADPGGPATTATTATTAARPRRPWLWPSVAAACLVLGAAAGFALGAGAGGGGSPSSLASSAARGSTGAPGLGAVAPAPTEAAPTLVVADGSDPQDTGCARLPGVETLDNTEVQQDGVPVGLAQLKYSPGCGASWPRFEPFPGAEISADTVVHVDIVRPATSAEPFAFSAPYVTDQATFGNLALSTGDCVYASVSLETAAGPTPASTTHCFRGKTFVR
ncbi:XRE family transcriptional regulator [Streptomyces sp. NP160]|uniref:helix-turn-helix domain-containing protein n=1 Tax=Streptomyces sp. NP160 TaxID=2586637 RepID=UPI00214C0742|nr:XRE family transcriptional regulator [Streptomyces sp. NP160]